MDTKFNEEFETETFDNAEVEAEGAVPSSQEETKADKFRRLANYRTNNILKQIQSLGKLSSPVYEYTPEQVEKIFGAIQVEIDRAKELFAKKEKTEQRFSL